MTFTAAREQDRKALMALWKTAFTEDSDGDIERFFSVFPIEDHALVLRENDTIVSMLFLLDTHIVLGNDRMAAGYIYAGATLPACRGKGYYRRLMDYALDTAEKRRMAAVFLRPATQSLFESYRRMGFCVPLTCRQARPHSNVVVEGKEIVDASQYVALRRQILTRSGTAFVDWDERVIALALSWCKAGTFGDEACVLMEQGAECPMIWEWLSADGSDLGTVCLTDRITKPTMIRCVGTDDTAALLRPIEDRVSDVDTPIYFGYGLE